MPAQPGQALRLCHEPWEGHHAQPWCGAVVGSEGHTPLKYPPATPTLAHATRRTCHSPAKDTSSGWINQG